VLGECLAECFAADECDEGQACDAFGRCAAPDADGSFPESGRAPEGTLALWPPLIQVAADSTRAFHLRAFDRDLGPVRVVAEGGAAVQCEPGGAFEAECRFDSLAVNAPRKLMVQAGAGVGSLRAYSGTKRVAASVARYGDDPVATPATRTAFSINPSVDGARTHFVGRARAVALGVGEPSAVPPFTMPLRAVVEVSDDTLLFELKDDFRVLTGSPSWVGTLDLDGAGAGAPTLSFPARPYLAGSALSDTQAEVVAQATASNVVLSGEDEQMLTFDLDVELVGTLPDDEAVVARWHVLLQERADAVDDGESVEPQADVTLAQAFGLEAARKSAWELAALKPLEAVRLRREDIYAAYAGTEWNAAHCAVDESDFALQGFDLYGFEPAQRLRRTCSWGR
jgi:hypothetical protein